MSDFIGESSATPTLPNPACSNTFADVLADSGVAREFIDLVLNELSWVPAREPGRGSNTNETYPFGSLRLSQSVSGETELSNSSARTVAAPRVSTPSFSKISCTCFLTVDSV